MYAMECRWIVVIGVIVINICNVKCDMINPEQAVDVENKSVDVENKSVIENNGMKDRHEMSLFPKMTKKFIVTLSPPRPVTGFRNTSKRRLLPQFTLKQRVNDPPVSNQFVITRQPLMKRRKFTVKPRTLNLSVNINNMNRKSPLFLNNQHKLKVKNNVTNNITSTSAPHDKDSSEEHIGDNRKLNETSKESYEMFQADTFGVSADLKKESKGVISMGENEFDVEVNTLSSVFSEENDSNDSIPSTSVAEKHKEHNETKPTSNKETLKVVNVLTNKSEYTAEENADRNEFLFTGSHIKNTKTAANKKIDASTTERTRNLLGTRRLERSINVIEEEHLATASSFFHSTGRDSILDLNYVYKNIHT